MIKIELTKKSATGKALTWVGEVTGNVITITHGQVGGKLQTESKTVDKGKNIGKVNETTPEQQALSELETTARKKMENDYTLVKPYKFTTVNEKQVKVQNKEIPAPMLAHPIEKHIKKVEYNNVAYQPKLDGFRAIYDVKNKKFYSRARKELIGCPHLIEQLSSLNFGDIEFLDGELYTHKLPFETISKIVSPKKTLAEKELREMVEYHIFDYVDTTKPFTERNELLQSYNYNCNKDFGTQNLKIVETRFIEVETIEKSLKPLIQTYIDKGYEGLMIRIPDSRYECKRSHGIFKYKLFEDCEAVCIGFKAEENNPNVLGSISFQLSNGNKFDARPALTEGERETLWKNQKKYIGQIGVIKYQELSQYGIPRFPVFTGKWREKWDISNG